MCFVYVQNMLHSVGQLQHCVFNSSLTYVCVDNSVNLVQDQIKSEEHDSTFSAVEQEECILQLYGLAAKTESRKAARYCDQYM